MFYSQMTNCKLIWAGKNSIRNNVRRSLRNKVVYGACYHIKPNTIDAALLIIIPVNNPLPACMKKAHPESSLRLIEKESDVELVFSML